jgi:AbrB family looped-hinge helix DNA binding protein
MQVSIDRAGRVVVPKPFRDQLGLVPGTSLEVEAIDGYLELRPQHAPPRVIEGPRGPVLARTGAPIGDDDVREMLEAAREHR